MAERSPRGSKWTLRSFLDLVTRQRPTSMNDLFAEWSSRGAFPTGARRSLPTGEHETPRTRVPGVSCCADAKSQPVKAFASLGHFCAVSPALSRVRSETRPPVRESHFPTRHPVPNRQELSDSLVHRGRQVNSTVRSGRPVFCRTEPPDEFVRRRAMRCVSAESARSSTCSRN